MKAFFSESKTRKTCIPLKIFLMFILFAMTTGLFSAEARLDRDKTESDEKYVSIQAGSKWNPVGRITLEKGKHYHFSVKGRWSDASINVNAIGYTSDSVLVPRMLRIFFSWAEHCRRAPDADWFSLICTIGRDYSTQMDIGKMLKNNVKLEINLTAQDTGPLYCFANDLPFMYWNNKGAISLKIIQRNGTEN